MKRLFLQILIFVFLILCGFMWTDMRIQMLAQEKKGISPPPTATPVPEQPPKVPEKKIESTPVNPVPEEQKGVEKKGTQGIPSTQPIPEEQKNVQIRNLQISPNLNPVSDEPLSISGRPNLSVSPLNAQLERQIEYKPFTLDNPSSIQPNNSENYMVKEFSDFRGGLNQSAYKTKLAPNEALDLENALWNPTGELYKRPGYSLESTPPEKLNFLYTYYKQNDTSYEMGGSDTALYFHHGDSTVWHYLIGTGGDSGRWDGTTFEDMFVGTHGGIEPVVWNGDTLINIGETSDSFLVNMSTPTFFEKDSLGKCRQDTEVVRVVNGNWVAQDWVAYFVKYSLCYNSTDTVERMDIVSGNTANCLYFRPGFEPHHYGILTNYLKFYSWFGVDTVWREGKIDSVVACTSATAALIAGVGFHWRLIWECIDQEGSSRYGWAHNYAKLYDFDSTWDSTVNYDQYIFEVTAGKGLGFKCFMGSYKGADVSGAWGAVNSGWSDSAFFVYPYTAECFDTTTEYRIYKPCFTALGAKFVENFDGHLWLGWTGIGTEQNKNILVWSALSDLGNFPPENNIILESEDGDYITGMKTFPSQYMDVPNQELVVGKNASLYKIVPSNDPDAPYDFWLIVNGVGFASNSAIAPIEGKALVFPDQNGVWLYDQRKVQLISQKIDPLVKAWDKENLESMSGIYNPEDRHYYLSYPESADTSIQLPSDTNVYAVICWWDDVGTHWDIRAQKFDFDMTKIDTAFTVNNRIDGDQNTPDIAYAQVGRWIFVWSDERDDTTDKDIAMRRFDANLQSLDTAIVISGSRVNNRTMPHIDCNRNGKCVVVWEDRRNNSLRPDIYGQRIDSNGTLMGNNFSILSSTGYPYYEPHVGIGSDGKFVVAWITAKMSLKDTVYFQRFDSSGTKIGNPVVVDTSLTSFILGSSCDLALEDETEKFMVIWEKKVGANNYDIYGRWYDSSGTALTTAKKINDDVIADNIQEYQSSAVNNTGQYICAWDDYRLDPWYNTYGQRYSDTAMVGSNFPVTPNNDYYKYSAVAIDEDGNFLVVSTALSETIGVWFAKYNWTGTKTDSGWGSDLQFNPDENAVAINPFYTETTITIDTIQTQTLAWSLDFGGWSEESFSASAYCYQHSPFDSVKILFADPGEAKVYNYGTQADDIGEPVILTYQTGYMPASEFPSYYVEPKYFTFEGSGTGGGLLVYWYKNYSENGYFDTLTCTSGDCRQEMILPDTLRGYNISTKIVTGTGWDEFILSRFWSEYQIDQRGRK